MNIGFFETQPWEKEAFERGKQPGWNVRYYDGALGAEALPPENQYDAISVFVNSAVDAAVLAHFPNLKLIVTRSTGYDHIDTNAAQQRGIVVCSVPAYGDNTVAEYTFGLMLALVRKIYLALNRVKERGTFSFEGLQGVDLKGKTLGVIGTGRIGREVIKIARGFSMNVVAFDMYPNAEYAASMGFAYAPYADVLKTADIVTFHVPYTPQTHHLFNLGSLPALKRGAYLINTSRGAVLETDALVKGLRDGVIAGVALDVLEEEGAIKDELNFLVSGHPNEESLKNALANHVLMEMPNVLISPHNAFNSKEAIERIVQTTLENVANFEKQQPTNVVR